MAQSLGFSLSQFPSHVCRLNKTIYGLRQSPHAWYSILSCRLTHLGFTISSADPYLFLHTSRTVTTFILVYIDDLLVICSSLQCISDLISALRIDFLIIDLHNLQYFQGVKANSTSKGLLLTLQKYITDLLQRTNMHLGKSVKSLMITSEKLSAFTGNLFEDPTVL